MTAKEEEQQKKKKESQDEDKKQTTEYVNCTSGRAARQKQRWESTRETEKRDCQG